MKEAVEALNNIRPGQVVCYFTGFLASSSGIYDVRTQAQILYDLGKVELAQRRLSPGTFEYLAIGKKERKVPRKRFTDCWGGK